MARLLRAQKIARAADLQIAHRDLEARAELRVLADGVEPLFRDLRQYLAPAERQIRIRVTAGAAHAAADLVQLRKTQPVRVLDDERVDVRDIDARLDDRRADQYLHVAVCHRLHHVAELFFVHLPVRHGDLGLRNAVLEPCGALVDRLHAVVQVIHLPAARKLPPDSLVQYALLMLEHERLHRITVLRRLFDGRHVAQTRQRHVERARDRRCR